MFKYFLITLYQLTVYVAVGMPLLLMPYPVIYLLLGKRRAYKYAIAVDILACVLAHGEFRTISGLTGDKKLDKRYKYQLIAINWLLKPFDGANHCERTHEHEQNIKYNYFEFFKG